VTFGDSGEVYAVSGNLVNLYKEGSGGDTLLISGDNTGDKFFKRMTMGSGVDYPDNVNGLLYSPQSGGKASLWIASSANVLPSVRNGIFYSFDEKSDEQNTTAFKYIHSDKKLTGGLKESYAFPGILNSLNGSKAMFAYNLSKASKVTIKIYDWNMDPVKTVIKNRDRPAGNDRANGRSTNAAEDTWDGTTDSGRRVAVGVYYYTRSARRAESMLLGKSSWQNSAVKASWRFVLFLCMGAIYQCRARYRRAAGGVSALSRGRAGIGNGRRADRVSRRPVHLVGPGHAFDKKKHPGRARRRPDVAGKGRRVFVDRI
jgi:hypothetical protein